jgi:hypothetical protein
MKGVLEHFKYNIDHIVTVALMPISLPAEWHYDQQEAIYEYGNKLSF